MNNSRTKLLTICIPTFERSPRLEATLKDLLTEIKANNLGHEVAVHVSNNGSRDSTSYLLADYREIFRNNDIDLTSVSLPHNIGAGANLINSILNLNSSYALCFSDDDNLFPGMLAKLLEDLRYFEPNVLIYNFDQPPYSKSNPLNKGIRFFEGPNTGVDLKNLVKWFKLTGVVFKTSCYENKPELISSASRSAYFSHVLMAAAISEKFGRLLVSEDFLAFPDQDFLNHTPFVPYVPEFLSRDILEIGPGIGLQGETIAMLNSYVVRSSVVSRSIHRLYEFYNGERIISRKVHQVLWGNLRDAFVFNKNISTEGLKLSKLPSDYLRLIRMILIFFVWTINGRKKQFFSESGY